MFRYEPDGAGGPDADGLVRRADVERVAVGLRMDGHRLDAQLLAGGDDAEGDLSPVGDEYLLEHVASARLDREQFFAELDRLRVLRVDRHDRARRVRLDLVHEFHRLDDAERLALLDDVARP